MGELADRGLLDAPDPERAAIHLIVLATGEVTQRSAQQLHPLADAEVVAISTRVGTPSCAPTAPAPDGPAAPAAGVTPPAGPRGSCAAGPRHGPCR